MISNDYEEEKDEINEGLSEKSEEEPIFYKYTITSYGADYPVDSIVKRIHDTSIYIPSFQRGFVWDLKRASRFIESLLLGLPVPGIFLSRDEETKKLLVIDGQQRLRTLEYFYDGIFRKTGREFALEYIESDYGGTTYKSLLEEDRRRLDDSIIHATIVRQDEPSDDYSSIFHIFERLNTGGLQLQPQEIRAAMYHGEFNNFIKDLNQNKRWRSIFGPISPRMRDQELIVRFLALYFAFDTYKKPMKEFLNIYMSKNKSFNLQTKEILSKTFTDTIEIVDKYLGYKAFRPSRVLIAAIYDAVMVGIARRLSHGKIENVDELKNRFSKLINEKNFITAIETHTSDEDKVKARIELATEAFAEIK